MNTFSHNHKFVDIYITSDLSIFYVNSRIATQLNHLVFAHDMVLFTRTLKMIKNTLKYIQSEIAM